MNLGPYRLRVEHRLRRRPTLSALAAVATLAALVVFAVPAGAGSNGTATGTVTIALRSVSVSPDTFTYDQCQNTGNATPGELLIPNGTCSTAVNALTVTNGDTPASIEVSASNFVPADNGTPWQLCLADPAPACTGGSLVPGPDQARAEVFNSVGTHENVINSPVCEHFFNTSCGESAAGEVAQVGADVIGPSSSTDQSPTFSNTITWIAAP